ncbi:hypothetical protein U0070_022737 [Myodes glareolus]|uniref:Uncharacterized protein n=1 Tax=Myodes glareolus TaxID=447135 RepID=A0AAW0J7L6_MYOGA
MKVGVKMQGSYEDDAGNSENGSVHGIRGNATHQSTEAKGNTESAGNIRNDTGREKKMDEHVISLGPPVAEGENTFGVCHSLVSFGDTFVHETHLSVKEPI